MNYNAGCVACIIMLVSALAAAQAPTRQPPTGQPPTGQTPTDQAPGQPPGAAPAAPGPAWLPRGEAELQALDKVNARTQTLSVRVGASARFGSLTIAVQSCVVRPPDQPADAAAFLVVTDATPGSPAFHGWMFQSDPAVSMLQHPIYDLRVLACRP
jgi:hypothetical protein